MSRSNIASKNVIHVTLLQCATAFYAPRAASGYSVGDHGLLLIRGTKSADRSILNIFMT